jgi:hypothetical protein
MDNICVVVIKGKPVIVDKEFEYLIKENGWRIQKAQSNKLYVIRNRKEKGKTKSEMLHRIICETPVGMDTDHINGNGLDNRKENLRICTAAQNLQNKSIYKNNKSGFKGVCFEYRSGKMKWVAAIRINNKRIFIGRFDSITDAAIAYNKKAKELFGEFARLNNL